MKVSLKDILEAQANIAESVVKTPLELSRSCSELLETNTYLKCENRQLTGSFKIRGACNKISSLSEEDKDKGVIAVSAGNHAQGVALSATRLGVSSTIVMPETTPLVKAEATKSYGAEVIFYGHVFDESLARAKEIQQEKNLTFVHPYNDPLIIAGQGTIGLEIVEQLDNVDSVIVSIGGGGLISGVATAIKALKPKCKVYGAVTEAFPGMKNLFHREKIELKKRASTIADGIAVKTPSEEIYHNFIDPLVDDICAVNDDAIAEAIVFLLERTKNVVEGSGAIVLAAARKAKWDLGDNCVLLISGGNIDLNLISKTIERGLVRSGRLARFSVLVNDQPGVLNKITTAIARAGANILEVHHDRLDMTLEFKQARIQILLETKNEEQRLSIEKAISKFAYKIETLKF